MNTSRNGIILVGGSHLAASGDVGDQPKRGDRGPLLRVDRHWHALQPDGGGAVHRYAGEAPRPEGGVPGRNRVALGLDRLRAAGQAGQTNSEEWLCAVSH